jgi:hypothetical protein
MLFQIAVAKALAANNNSPGNGQTAAASGAGSINLNDFLNGTATAGPSQTVQLPSLPPPIPSNGGSINLGNFLNGTGTAAGPSLVNLTGGAAPSLGAINGTSTVDDLKQLVGGLVNNNLKQVDQALQNLDAKHPGSIATIHTASELVKVAAHSLPDSLKKTPLGKDLVKCADAFEETCKHYENYNKLSWGSSPVKKFAELLALGDSKDDLSKSLKDLRRHIV